MPILKLLVTLVMSLKLEGTEVKGFSKVACGGTHLKRTGEVGEIQLKRKNIGKGKERVEISLKTPVM